MYSKSDTHMRLVDLDEQTPVESFQAAACAYSSFSQALGTWSLSPGEEVQCIQGNHTSYR